MTIGEANMEVEMESCSESMAPGAWSSASPALTIDKACLAFC